LFDEINQQMMEVCYKKIFGRFVKKVVQYRRQRIQHEQDLDKALDYAIEIPHRAQLDAWKSVSYAESAVNYLLECQGEAVPNEELDEADLTDSEDEDVESKHDIAQRIAEKINALKNIYTTNESVLNHKHSDLTRTKVNDCLKMVKNDYEKQLKSITSKDYIYEENGILRLKHLESKVDKETKDMLANVEHSKASQITRTMQTTEPPAWLWSLTEDAVEYWTELSGEQNLYRLTADNTLMLVGSYNRVKDEDGFKVRVMTFMDTPVEAVEPVQPEPEVEPEQPPAPAPAPTAVAPEPQTTASHNSTCPFDESQIIVNYTYMNDFEKFVHAKKMHMDPSRNWNHIAHGVDTNDKDTTLCRVVIAKYSKSIQQPTLDDMQYEVHYYRCEKAGKKKALYLDEDTKLNWQPSKHLWSKLLVRLGLTSPDDISEYGCRV
jgi:hypothetical protein